MNTSSEHLRRLTFSNLLGLGDGAAPVCGIDRDGMRLCPISKVLIIKVGTLGKVRYVGAYFITLAWTRES